MHQIMHSGGANGPGGGGMMMMMGESGEPMMKHDRGWK
jgi:hypothetical protein